MHHLDGSAIWDMLDGTLHADTQQHALTVDLSAATITHVKSPGALDFGGSEMQAAAGTDLAPRKKHEDDDYGWWTLPIGYYQVTFNEGITLQDDQHAIIRPLQRLLQAGALMPNRLITATTSPLQAWFHVPIDGLRIKENARLAEIMVHG